MKAPYIKLETQNGRSYIEPESTIVEAILDELETLEDRGGITLTLTPMFISDSEYASADD